MSASELTRILYVEDDDDIRTIGTFALEIVGGFTVEACRSGVEALERAPEFAPQLLLLDVMMPVLDGPTTLTKLRELQRTADTPVIFMTAKVQPHEVESYRAMGALDVISKPFEAMTLPDAIRAIWTRPRA